MGLNSLRERGFIEWKSGGLTKKRGKYGQPLANDYTLKIPIDKEKCEDKSAGRAVHNSMAMSPRTTPTEITTKNKKEISNRNSAGVESDSSIDLAIKEFV